MIIELRGANFTNKGAELMMRAAIFGLKAHLDNVEFAVDARVGQKRNLKQLGLIPILHTWIPKRSRLRGKIKAYIKKTALLLVPHFIFRKLGYMLPLEPNALIDISGFQYSDQWHPNKSEDLAQIASFYHKNGKPVILLPQSFGPFERRETKEAFIKALRFIDLAIARDQESYNYVAKITASQKILFKAPDMVMFYNKEYSGQFMDAANSHYCCIGPNSRVLDKTNLWNENYIKLLANAAQTALEHRIKVKIITFSTNEDDIAIAKELVRNAGNKDITAINEDDPFQLMKIVGGSRFVIGSRYHFLVSAFSQSVPSLGVGWSHKYDELYNDFGFKDFIITPEIAPETVQKKLELLINPESNNAYRKLIQKNLKPMKEENEVMWKRVVETLRQARPLT